MKIHTTDIYGQMGAAIQHVYFCGTNIAMEEQLLNNKSLWQFVLNITVLYKTIN